MRERRNEKRGGLRGGARVGDAEASEGGIGPCALGPAPWTLRLGPCTLEWDGDGAKIRVLKPRGAELVATVGPRGR